MEKVNTAKKVLNKVLNKFSWNVVIVTQIGMSEPEKVTFLQVFLVY